VKEPVVVVYRGSEALRANNRRYLVEQSLDLTGQVLTVDGLFFFIESLVTVLDSERIQVHQLPQISDFLTGLRKAVDKSHQIMRSWISLALGRQPGFQYLLDCLLGVESKDFVRKETCSEERRLSHASKGIKITLRHLQEGACVVNVAHRELSLPPELPQPRDFCTTSSA